MKILRSATLSGYAGSAPTRPRQAIRHALLACKAMGLVCAMGLMCLPATWVQAASAPVYEGTHGWLFPEWESTIVFDKSGIDANVELLKAAKDLFAAHQIELVVMLVPTKALFYPERLPSDREVSPEVKGRYAYIREAMGKAGITVPDLRPVLKSVETGKHTAYYRTDYHWTSMGAEAAANVAAQAVLRSTALKGNPGTGAVLGEWVNERHYGDLSSRYLAASRRVAIGRDIFRVRLPPTGSTQLFDEDPAPVHVMGNSFVQPYWGFSQKLSNVLDRPVSLTWNAGNVGQWVICLTYLESKDFAETKPQAIVWQMNEAQIQYGPQDAGLWDVQGLMPPQTWLSRLKSALTKPGP